ncbi:MAG: hypothetical protein ABI895_01980 [Deltaproteobacteria bacterium]
MADSTPLLIVAAIVVAVLLVAAVAVTLWRNAPSRKRQQLREKFGPEYDIAVEQYGATRAQRVLEARARRVGKLPLRSLSPSECATFSQSWRRRQEQFVDTPSAAVSGAHELVQRVMLARGYPVEDFEQSVADLSVEYGAIVSHYRAAHQLEQANRSGQINTEELRQAMVHYRALFDELLGTAAPSVETIPPSERAREQRDPEHRPQA